MNSSNSFLSQPHKIIQAVQLEKRIGDTVVLQDASFSLSPEETCAIVGPSGSGKSTLLQILGLLDKPSCGRLELCGVDTASATSAELALMRNRMIGFVFQAYHLLPRLTSLQNVVLPLLYRGVGARDAQAKARKAIDAVGMGAKAASYPRQLSGGQRQRIAIARAIVGGPNLILADEPTGNLDSASANEILALLFSLRTALVIVTHDLQLASRCGRTVVIKDGRIQ